jgi:thioredoxin-like negative regulator of GroEL
MPLLPTDLQDVCAQHWADTMIRMGRPLEAAGLLRDILSRRPDSFDARLALARTLAHAGQFEEARKEYERLIGDESIPEAERARFRREYEKLQEQPASES